MNMFFGQIPGGDKSKPRGEISGRNALRERAEGTTLTLRESLELLKQYGVNVLGKVAVSRGEAEAMAREWGADSFVLKAATQKKQKMASGMIELDVPVNNVGKRFEAMMASHPDAEGVWVAPMAEHGVEMMVGARMTEYGVVVVMGAGGTCAENMRDTVLLVEPQSSKEIAKAMGKLRMAPLLKGEQGLPEQDILPVAEIGLKLARLVRDNPDLEVDLNPVRLKDKEEGGYASILDCRLVPNEKLARPPEAVIDDAEATRIIRAGLNPKSIAYVGASDRRIGMTRNNEIVPVLAIEHIPEFRDCVPFSGTEIAPAHDVATVRINGGQTKLVVGKDIEIIDTPNRTLADNLSYFPGDLFFVNPKGSDVLGRKAHKSVRDLPIVPEMAVVLVKAEDSLDVLEELGKKGTKFVVMENSGFKEVGNSELEARLLEIIKRYGMVVIGPNGIGITKQDAGVDSMFLARHKNTRMQGGGKTTIESQSGSLVSIRMEDEAEIGARINAFFSVGNMSGVTHTQMLKAFSEDPGTGVIGIVAEGIPDGRRFMETANRVARTKPIVVLKLGRSGSEKTVSHTGSLAGDNEAFLEQARRNGIIVVKNIQQFFLAVKMLENQPLPKTDEVAIITNAGGQLSQAHDDFSEAGIRVSKLGEPAKTRIRKVVSSNVTVDNAAIDLAADSNPAIINEVVGAMKQDENVGTLVIAPYFQPPTMTDAVVGKITGHQGDKPIMVVLNESDYAKQRRQMFEEAGIPTTTRYDDAAVVIKAIQGYAEWRDGNPPGPVAAA